MANSLLASLRRADRERIVEVCEPAELRLGHIICDAGDPVRHVYFPTNGYISLVTPPGATESLEVGMVGSEGALGVTLILGVRVSPLRCLVQGAGTALRMSSRRFAGLLEDSTALRDVLSRYLFVLTSQLAQTAACNRYHHLTARTARWLLMTHDRASGDTFPLTHQFMAYMLGVRRSGITDIAGQFQDQGIIRYSRGAVTVLDRARLQAASCQCYDVVNATYRKYLGARTVVAGPRERLEPPAKKRAKSR